MPITVPVSELELDVLHRLRRLHRLTLDVLAFELDTEPMEVASALRQLQRRLLVGAHPGPDAERYQLTDFGQKVLDLIDRTAS